MRIVFWQNRFSPHQIPYISKIICDRRVDSVDVIVPLITDSYRRSIGWESASDGINNTTQYNLYIEPNDTTIDSLFSKQCDNSIHLFSGIRSFPFVYKAFKKSLIYNISRGLIVEKPNTFAFGLSNGKPMWIHRCRFIIQDKYYIPYIHYIFAIGSDAVDYYKGLSNTWKIYPFAYCTEQKFVKKNKPNNDFPRIVYVGGLEWWKDPFSIINASEKIIQKSVFAFIGDGRQRKSLQKRVIKISSITPHEYRLVGIVNHNCILEKMANYDVLILPSKYDGWGAVVNEALSVGCYCIVSDRCGASDLIYDSSLGRVYKKAHKDALFQTLFDTISNINEIREKRGFRIEWARTHISGEVIAKYMVDCLSGMKVNAPWIDK